MKFKLNLNFLDLRLFRKVLRFVKPYRKTYNLVLLSAILLSIVSTATPYLLKITIDDYIVVKDYSGMVLFLSFLMITLILEVVFQFLFVFYANWLGQKVVKDIRLELFQKLMNFKMAYYDKSAVGRLVTRVVSDIETIASIFSQGLFMIIADLLKMAVIIAVMLMVSLELSAIVFICFPLVIITTKWFQSVMKKAFEDVRREVGNINTFVQERISGMKIVQIFHREDVEQKKFESINNNLKKAWLKTVWYNSFFFPITEIISSLTIGLLVWYGGLRVVVGGSITFGAIFLFIQLAQMLYRPLRQIADKFNTLQMGMVASERIFKILDDSQQIEVDGQVETSQIQGNIKLIEVSFSYVKGEKVLKSINLDIHQGETIAIVGPTGSGKSTIINLISRFYEIQEGTITIDGINIQDYKLDSLRKHVAIVLQDVFLFAGTLKENITLFDDSISDELVIEAAKKIGIHAFIQSLPGQYHFDVKERGNMLSSGQRQLIAFLRAYIINPPVLILDEATSSIDSYSEDLIQNAIGKITKNKTSIIIAHRLATIKNADRIVVLDKGEIIEMGNHSQLIKKDDGYYSKFFENQIILESTEEMV
ncbi:MAG: ABC transporter ATP-binding protein [Flavobacteriaceae bacterium]|nr:ABC transporter ATP-binding protein [Flavobacteriaceae bacterium]MCY4217633.1 ABC transporter ATP-binding protein [Flavobacteriaceae bacterium]